MKMLALTLLLLAPALYAGDEDMSPSAYQIFDPETGFTITVEPDPTLQDHGPGVETPSVALANTDNVAGSDSDKQSGRSKTWISIVAAAALLIAALTALKRLRG